MLDYVSNLDPVVHYVSSPCGRGKTYAACKFMRDNKFRSNHLYVAPSRRLVAETEKTLKTFGVDPMVITSDTHADHVKASIIEFMNHAEDAGEILLITWNAYVDLPYVNRRENWRVMTGLKLSRLGLSPNEIEAELFAVIGSEPHMRKKILNVIKSLRKYRRSRGESNGLSGRLGR